MRHKQLPEKEQARISARYEIAKRGWYGVHLTLDLHSCNPEKFNRKDIEEFFKQLCEKIKMIRADLHWWDDVGVPKEEQQIEAHTMGSSAVQFILTSSIVIHSLSYLRSSYIDIFSCKPFNAKQAENFAKKWFESSTVISHFITRTYIQ